MLAVAAGASAASFEASVEVTLFCAPGSVSDATVTTLLDAIHPDEIERSLYEVDHVALAFEAIDDATAGPHPFDVIHDHCGFTAIAMADRIIVLRAGRLVTEFARDKFDQQAITLAAAHSIRNGAPRGAAAKP